MTVLVRSGHKLWVDHYQNLRIDLKQAAPAHARKPLAARSKPKAKPVKTAKRKTNGVVRKTARRKGSR
jgi:hypothetical protein